LGINELFVEPLLVSAVGIELAAAADRFWTSPGAPAAHSETLRLLLFRIIAGECGLRVIPRGRRGFFDSANPEFIAKSL
jgi:hypothetical protein